MLTPHHPHQGALLTGMPTKSVLWLLFLMVMGTASCSTVPSATTPVTETSVHTGLADPEPFWWRCRFRIKWPADSRPDMAVDLMIAHGIVQPVLVRYEREIQLWRFHRRAARDASGHQFSFLFFTNRKVAAAVFQEIKAVSLLAEARKTGIVQSLLIDDLGHPFGRKVEATSDSSWSPELQRSWPVYIMGVSAAWLDLISACLPQEPPADQGIQTLMGRYQAAQDAIQDIWYHEGQHAFLHHLSALFGYQVLRIQRDIQF